MSSTREHENAQAQCGGSGAQGEPRAPKRRRSGLVVFAIVLAAMLTRVPGLDPNLTDHDTWRQTDTATIARNFLEEPRILWPRIDWGAPGPGYVETEFQLYPFVVSIIYRLLGENPLYGRLLSIALTGIACVVLHRIARRFLGESGAITALCLFAMSPIAFRYSRTFMPEATVLLFYLLALERFLAFQTNRRWATLLEAAICMALAILVKPTSIHLGLVLIILVVFGDGWRALFKPQLLTFGAIALGPAIAYYAHAARIHAVYGNTFGVISGGDPKWGGPSWWFDPGFWWSLLYMDTMWTLGPVGAMLALASLLGRRRSDLKLVGRTWAAVLVVYYCIVARYAGDERAGIQYHVYAAPLAAILAAAGLDAAVRWAAGFRRVPRAVRSKWAATLVALALVAGYQMLIDVLILAKPRHTHMISAGSKLAELSSPGDVVVVLSESGKGPGAASNNFEQPDVFFHARRRGRVLARDRQSGDGLSRALRDDARWFVNFPALNGQADSSFREELTRRASLAYEGETFQIYTVRTSP